MDNRASILFYKDYGGDVEKRVGSVNLGLLPNNLAVSLVVPIVLNFDDTPPAGSIGLEWPIQFFKETRALVPDTNPPETTLVSRVALDPQPEVTLTGISGTTLYYVDENDEDEPIEPRYYLTPIFIPPMGEPSVLVREPVPDNTLFHIQAEFSLPAGMTPGNYQGDLHLFWMTPGTRIARMIFNLGLLDGDTLFQQDPTTVWYHTI